MTPAEEVALSMVTLHIWKEEMSGHITHDEAVARYELARLGDFRWNEVLWQGLNGVDQAVKPMYEEMLLVSYDEL